MGKLSKELLEARRQACNIHTYLHSHLVLELINHIDAIEAEKDKLIENVAQLQKELQQEREGKKVALPKEVAAAVEWFREQSLSNEEIYELSTNDDGGKYASILYKWSDTGLGDGNILMQALVNGYTIEEPPSVESRIQSTIYAELKRQGVTSPAPIDYVAKCLTDLISPIVVKDAFQHEQS